MLRLIHGLGSLRRLWSIRTRKSLASTHKSALDHILSEVWFWRTNAAVLLGSRQLWPNRSHSLRFRLHPSELRQLRKHLDRVVADRDRLFFQFDLQALQSGKSCPAVRSKQGFSQACAKHNLPHIPTILLQDDREFEVSPDKSAFIKPDKGSRARGCAVLTKLGPIEYSLKTQQGETKGPLAAILGRHCPAESLVIQPMLENAPAIAAIVGRVPLTVRVVTGLANRGARLLSALVEIPLDETLPIARQWAIVPIDRASGRIAPFEFPYTAETRCHPVTGARIAGYLLPKWRSIVDLVENAHLLIAAEMPTVGWDLALTPGGPVLIEANRDWSVATHCANSSGFDLSAARRFKQFAKEL